MLKHYLADIKNQNSSGRTAEGSRNLTLGKPTGFDRTQLKMVYSTHLWKKYGMQLAIQRVNSIAK